MMLSTTVDHFFSLSVAEALSILIIPFLLYFEGKKQKKNKEKNILAQRVDQGTVMVIFGVKQRKNKISQDTCESSERSISLYIRHRLIQTLSFYRENVQGLKKKFGLGEDVEFRGPIKLQLEDSADKRLTMYGKIIGASEYKVFNRFLFGKTRTKRRRNMFEAVLIGF